MVSSLAPLTAAGAQIVVNADSTVGPVTVFDGYDSAADILRRERAAFRDSPQTASSTYLAYQYFGHPSLKLERTKQGQAARTATTTATVVS